MLSPPAAWCARHAMLHLAAFGSSPVRHARTQRAEGRPRRSLIPLSAASMVGPWAWPVSAPGQRSQARQRQRNLPHKAPLREKMICRVLFYRESLYNRVATVSARYARYARYGHLGLFAKKGYKLKPATYGLRVPTSCAICLCASALNCTVTPTITLGASRRHQIIGSAFGRAPAGPCTTRHVV